jgi:hypothetical protein
MYSQLPIINRLNFIMRQVYNKCVITNTPTTNVTTYDTPVHDIIVHTIVPLNNLIYSEYNNILLTRRLSYDMNNLKFSIHPEALTVYYKRDIFGNQIKYGRFRVVPHPSYDQREVQIELLYESRHFLKYHFLKFMEYYKSFVGEALLRRNLELLSRHHGVGELLNSDNYLYNTLCNISHVRNDGAIDVTGDMVMYESIKVI